MCSTSPPPTTCCHPARRIARAFAASAEELDIPPGEVPKPYTVPPGYKAPTLGEQFRYVSWEMVLGAWGWKEAGFGCVVPLA